MNIVLAVAVAVAVLLALAAPVSVSADPSDTVLLEQLTWTELRSLIGTGRTTLIVPVGGTEQNGPHMALGKHNVRVRALAERIARVLGTALVAPVLAYVPEGTLDPPTGHMRFPGTLTVPEDVFRRTLEFTARSARLHGFRHVVFLGDHGSTRAGEQAVAARLNREWAATPVRVHAVGAYYRAATDGMRQWLRERGYPDEEIGRHAGLADTSLMLAIDPSLVRSAGRATTAAPGEATGVDGDPGRASAELGRVGIELIVATTVDAIRASINSAGRR